MVYQSVCNRDRVEVRYHIRYGKHVVQYMFQIDKTFDPNRAFLSCTKQPYSPSCYATEDQGCLGLQVRCKIRFYHNRCKHYAHPIVVHVSMNRQLLIAQEVHEILVKMCLLFNTSNHTVSNTIDHFIDHSYILNNSYTQLVYELKRV